MDLVYNIESNMTKTVIIVKIIFVKNYYTYVLAQYSTIANFYEV